MHGLVNRALQCFLRDTYGNAVWKTVAEKADLEIDSFEAMLLYEDRLTFQVLDAAGEVLSKAREDLLEDLGTYLVSHQNLRALRRLLRFGGGTFLEFLHSLDDLPDRVRLAVPDMDLPELELHDHTSSSFSLRCGTKMPGFGHVIMGVLRALADDYGALVFLEHAGRSQYVDVIEITLLEAAFAKGRSFELAPQSEVG